MTLPELSPDAPAEPCCAGAVVGRCPVCGYVGSPVWFEETIIGEDAEEYRWGWHGCPRDEAKLVPLLPGSEEDDG